MQKNEDLGYIEVLRPGMGCSVQDQGRVGFFSEGIPQAGVMNANLSNLANQLLLNKADSAVIEFKSIPPKLLFSSHTAIVVAGFDMKVLLNTVECKTFSILSAQSGDVLELKIQKVGGYGYIAVSGGVQTEKILGSRSFFEHITPHAMLKKGMRLPILNNEVAEKNTSYCKLKPKLAILDIAKLRVFKAPEFYLLSEAQQHAINKKLFSLDYQSNRMGYLLNEPFYNHEHTMISSPVLPGTVQWTPSGKLIILMKDAQTMGGYPRILQLDEAAVTTLAAVAPNGFVRFDFSDFSS